MIAKPSSLYSNNKIYNTNTILDVLYGRFQATGTPMAKILRLHLSAQCALREITILINFAIEKVEKNISLQRFRDLETLFQNFLKNCFKRTVN
jgi:hypothetical protein